MAPKLPPPFDDALRARFEAAREADRIADHTEPRARDAWYDPQTGLVHVELKNGARIAFPPALFPELEDRTARELIELTVSPAGDGLLWDNIDVHIATAGVLVALLGPSMFRAFASVGGKARTERKAAAARENGRKGGRPRKQPGDVRLPRGPRLDVRQVAEVRQNDPSRDDG